MIISIDTFRKDSKAAVIFPDLDILFLPSFFYASADLNGAFFSNFALPRPEPVSQWLNVISLHRALSQSRSYRSRRELANEIGVTTVTFDRLVRILREEFGAPLVFSKKYGGYRYETKDGESFEIPGLWFKTGELEALIYMKSIAEGLQRGFLADAYSAFRVRLGKALESRDVSLKDWRGRFKLIPIAGRRTDL